MQEYLVGYLICITAGIQLCRCSELQSGPGEAGEHDDDNNNNNNNNDNNNNNNNDYNNDNNIDNNNYY
ncbi:unnamed protein product [Nippostrongylus brasiliensis]|uniref:Uncharacterized protein n=1 Tax=Nippostrongylus brasiliensis TaxID=27835 RepID=A0A0N4YPF2_NIPBR|nr:unnamed protein product [Nippostrongylus brasiliensis]